MKVVYVVGWSHNFTGSQRSLALTVSRLPPDVQPHVLLLGSGRTVAGFSRMGVPVKVLPAPDPLDTFGGELLEKGVMRQLMLFARHVVPYAVSIFRWFREVRPDLVHCNDVRAVLLAGWAARLYRRPVVWHLRGENVLIHEPLLNAVVHGLSSAVITVAEALSDGVSRGTPVRNIYNGIDDDAYSVNPLALREMEEFVRRDEWNGRECFRLVTVSSFVPYKGLHHLADALGLLLDARPDLRSRIVWLALGDLRGAQDPEYVSFLRARIAANGIQGNVLWPGWKDEAFTWIHGADVLALPTVAQERLVVGGEGRFVTCAEGFPRSVLEAMLAGCPTIASDVAGVAEALVHGETGFLVPPGDPAALKDAVERLVDDPQLRQSMAESGQERVGRFSLNRCVRETVSFYEDLLAGRVNERRGSSG